MFNEPDISGKPESLCACIGTVSPRCLEHIMFITGAGFACSSWGSPGLLWSTHRQRTELKFQGGQQPNWHNNLDGLLNIWISPPKFKKKKKSPSWAKAKFPREEGKCVQRNTDVEHLSWMWFRLVVQRWGHLLFFNRKTKLWTNQNQQWASLINVVFWFPALFAEVLSTYNSYLRQTELQMFSNVSHWSLLCPLNPKTQQPFNCNFLWLISSKET